MITTKISPRQLVQQFDRAAHHASARSLTAFMRAVLIDSDPPKRFLDAAEPWQWDLLNPIIPALESAAGLYQPGPQQPGPHQPGKGRYSGPQSFYYVLPRGHDKTSLIANLSLWASCYSRTPLSMVAAAADKDQAAILLERVEAAARLNRWVGRQVEVNNWQLLGPNGSILTILSSDAPTSSGLLADVIVMDELTFWRRRDLYDVLASGAMKRQNCVQIIITNAGIKGTWQEDILKVARASPRFWRVYEAPGFIAGWYDPETIAQKRKELLPSFARRIYDNQWLDPGELGSYLSRLEIAACVDDSLAYRRSEAELLALGAPTQVDRGDPDLQDILGACVGNPHTPGPSW